MTGRAPNYLAKIATAYRLGLFQPGTVTDVYIYHDDWCAIWRGGACDCNPEVKVGETVRPLGEKGDA